MGNAQGTAMGTAAVQNQLFNIKFTAKEIHRMSKKCEKEHTQELTKVKKAMEKGDAESARIYAENAIRIKNTGNGYLRMASRLEAVASRLESASKMQQISKQMGNVVKGMDKVLASMDMNQIGAVMDKFEASFDQEEVTSQCMTNAMDASTAATMPEDAVESLLQQVSDEHGLQFASRAADASTAPVAMSAPTAALQDSQEDALEKRLAALRSVG